MTTTPQRVTFEPRTCRLENGNEVRLRLIEPDDGPLPEDTKTGFWGWRPN